MQPVRACVCRRTAMPQDILPPKKYKVNANCGGGKIFFHNAQSVYFLIHDPALKIQIKGARGGKNCRPAHMCFYRYFKCPCLELREADGKIGIKISVKRLRARTYVRARRRYPVICCLLFFFGLLLGILAALFGQAL